MENILKVIKENNLISPHMTIGVACSGGSDSMALLHKLWVLRNELQIDVVAITIDHSIRENSASDVEFVDDFCSQNNIRCYKFKVDVPHLAKQKAISLESAGREARYGIFDALIAKGVVDKIALAHHLQDQAETLLMHLFRGAGLSGLKGMEYENNSKYIRPLLNTSKQSVLDYIKQNSIPYVTDETNLENTYARNYLRNEIMPLIIKKWPNAVTALNNFSKLASEDDEYIYNHLNDDALIIDDKIAQIPLTYFNYEKAVIVRIIFKALHGIGINIDIERKHIDAIIELSKGENGKRINLPFGVTAHKEYEYITLVCKKVQKANFFAELKCGEVDVPNYGKIIVKRVKDFDYKPNVIYIDLKKVPKGAMWRYRKDGDIIEKFGGGTKKLKSFLIDKKVPSRERDFIPVLAYGNEVFAVAGLEISDKVKLDENVKSALKVEVIKNN